MSALTFLSNCIMPILLLYIVTFALVKRVNVFDSFLTGAKEGVQVAVNLIPTMVGLFVGIGVLRASGFLEWLSESFSRCLSVIGITESMLPAELIPVIFTRPLSASAATGLALDLFENYGPDSFIGFAASLILSCSETVVYTMSVYFGSVKITKTRYTLAGGLLATFVGVVVSLIIANVMI